MFVIYAVVHIRDYMKRIFACQVFLLYRFFLCSLTAIHILWTQEWIYAILLWFLFCECENEFMLSCCYSWSVNTKRILHIKLTIELTEYINKYRNELFSLIAPHNLWMQAESIYAHLLQFIICEREKNSAPKTVQRTNRIYEGKSNEQLREGIGTKSSNANIIERIKPSPPKIIMSVRPSMRENLNAANDV